MRLRLLHTGSITNQTRFRVEKYRPVTLDDVVSHHDITSTSECAHPLALEGLTNAVQS